MSASDTQQIMDMLQEIERLLIDIEPKIANIERKQPQLESALQTFKDIERLALRWLVITRRLGLPEDVGNALDKIARLLVMINMLQMSMSMLMATNPFTVGIGVAGGVGVALSMGDMMAGY